MSRTFKRRLGWHSGLVGGAVLAAALGTSARGAEDAALPVPVLKNVIPYAAEALPLSAVRLTGGPLKTAQELDAKYLLTLEPDRMLYYLRVRAGLTPKAQQGYAGWDGGGRQLTGHIVGHYLSAISYMYAATGDAHFKQRVDYIVGELAEIQNKQGDGYVGALMGNGPRAAGGGAAAVVEGKPLFEELATGTIRSGGFDLNGMWSPWYVEHKIFAGLRDAYRETGNKDALKVEVKLAEWVDGILSKLTPAQIQTMLATEFGGMNESMADLYADTGDKRWLKACDYFQHHAIIDPLAQKRDILGGKHGNTQVPKMLGELERYVFTGQELSGNSSKFFWDAVAEHHTFATGGHGYDEYFGAPDKLSGQVDGTGQRSQDLRTCESCNVYNMLKMTRKLFALDPDIKYADFMERGLFNHVLASIDLNNGNTCYMVPVGQGVTHEYQNMMQSFTCCVGTGMESHALHGDGIFYESGDKLWANLFVPCTAQWAGAGASLAMETDFPMGETASLAFKALLEPKTLTINIRRPAWAGEGFALAVNGEAVKDLGKPDSYVAITRTWKTGDVVSIKLPKELHTEPLADDANRVALMWGPLVLGGDMGAAQGRGGRAAAAGATFQAFVDGDEPVAKWLKPVADKPGTFHAVTEAKTDLNFVPFYQLSERRYGIYWDDFTPAEWAKKGGQLTADQEQRNALAAATVAYAQPGEMQPERDYNFQGEDATVVRVRDEDGRRGSKWFSFDMPVDATKGTVLVVTYDSDEAARRSFDILVDGTKVATQVVEKSAPARFYDVEYAVPDAAVQGKTKATVKFQASAGSEIAGVFGIRIKRAEK